MPETLDDYRRRGETLLNQGEPLQAYDLLAAGLARFTNDFRLRQLTALALARTGASRLAGEMLEQLAADGHDDEETLGLLARTYKDRAVATVDPEAKRRLLHEAMRRYLAAYERSSGYWSGINAATMALLAGDRGAAQVLARDVRARCLALHDGAADPDYWLLATLGEAALLLGDVVEAEGWYRRAAALARARYGDLASTRRNARLIVDALGLAGVGVEQWLRVPRVAVFSGHLIDRPDRLHPRFPPAREEEIRLRLREWLRHADAGFAYASAAAGADILFLEEARRAGASVHVVLPYDRAAFRRDSVEVVPGSRWAERFEEVLDSAAEIVTASEQAIPGSAVSFEYGFALLDALAALRADALDTDLLCLAVWDGRPGDGPGGTAASVARWREARRQLTVLELSPERQARTADRPRPAPRGAAPAAGSGGAFDPAIVGLLFADARGFSKLGDGQVPAFVEHFLGTVAREIASSGARTLVANTWGDGLYFAFRSVRDTGVFALRLCEAVRQADWTGWGLPASLSLRVGLHAGPAYACTDPVTRRLSVVGAHVSRAARIEPITPPGEVYASGAFAALARSEQVQEFVCAYVGMTPLSKGYGTWPTYVVHATW